MTTTVAKRRSVIPAWASDFGVARIEDYFGPWAYEEIRFTQTVESVRAMDISAHIMAEEKRREEEKVELRPVEVVRANTDESGVAVFALRGSLMKQVGSLTNGTSTVWVRQLLRAARLSPEVRAGIIRIDSPGGTVAGTTALFDEIAAFAAEKPIIAAIEDVCASGAYWPACACTEIYAEQASLIGCIGTYGVLCDSSKAAELRGIKVHVIRAGAMKGAGTPGTEVTDAMLADAQRVIEELNKHFLDAVASGRKFSAARVQEIATGQVWVAEKAKEMGLINAIGSFDQARAKVLTLVDKNGGARRKERARMSGHENDDNSAPAAPPAPKAATFQELKATFPKADAAWRESCQERNLTLAQAHTAWTEKLDSDLTSTRAELEKAQTELKTLKDAAALRPGSARPVLADKTAPQAETEAQAGTAAEQFEAKIQELRAANKKMTREEAFSKVVTENPKLHEAYVQEKNASKGNKK